MRTFLSILSLVSCCGAADYQHLFDKKQLFDLRDAVLNGEAPAFFHAVIACSFNDEAACVRESKAVLNTDPPSEVAINTYESIFGYHFVRAQWSEAAAALDAAVAIQGEAEDPGNLRGLCRAFQRHGPMRVERCAHSSIHVLYKNAHVPFSVNGRPYHGYVDTGAGFSMLTESAARQLGLPVEKVSFQFGDSTGNSSHSGQIALADRFVIGNIELRNVPFVIVSDRQQPFASWGAGKRCVIGIQVLVAARTMTWKGGHVGAALELARQSARLNVRDANLCFDGMGPLTVGTFQGHRLTLFVDTGAGKSALRASFASNFPDLVRHGQRRTIYSEGVAGAASAEAAIIRELTLSIAGRNTAFRKIPVYLKGHPSEGHDGILGNDLTNKAHEFTIDFEAMRLSMR